MGSEVLLSILDSVQVKEEPLDTALSEDPLAVDLSPLVKLEISDNPLIINEDVLSHHVDPGTETSGETASPSFYQLKSVFPCKEVNLHPIPAASLKIKSVRSRSSLPFLLPASSSSFTQERSVDQELQPSPAAAKKEKRKYVKSTEVEDYHIFRKLKKVKLERDRRVAQKELFEDLDYWVTLGMDERSRK